MQTVAIATMFAVAFVSLTFAANRQARNFALAGFSPFIFQSDKPIELTKHNFLGGIISSVLKPVTTVLQGRYDKDVAKKQQETAQNVAKEETTQSALAALSAALQAKESGDSSSPEWSKWLLFGGIGIAVILVIILIARK